MVTNLQLKAKTIQILAPFVKGLNDNSYFNVFIAWVNEFRDGNAPAENANVTTASIPEELVAEMYIYLLSQPVGITDSSDLNDFVTSLVSKRNGDPILDARLTDIELQYSNVYTANKTAGRNLLLGT